MRTLPRDHDVVRAPGLPALDISLRQYDPLEAQPWHDHRDAHLVLPIRGGFTERWRGRLHDCTAATALVRPAEEIHANRYRADGAVCLVVRLDPQWTDLVGGYGIGAGCHQAAELRPLAARLFHEMQCRDSATPLAAHAIVVDILSRIAPRRSHVAERRVPGWIRATMDFLQSRLNAPLDVRETARVAGVHPAHLSRTFRRVTGLTMGGYVRRERLAKASDRLRRSDDAIATIALDSGFYDQAHFSRIFRQAFGLSPREFRRTHRAR